MMTLTTVSRKIDDGSAKIFWRVGINRKGVLLVDIGFSHDESDLIAELLAIRHLLFEKAVFDRTPSNGQGYKLMVSKGAIKKLALGKSSKSFAKPYAMYLSQRLSSIDIDVSQSMSWMDETEENVEELTFDGNLEAYSKKEVTTSRLGTITITQHAIDQYAERLSTGDPKNPLASLIGRLQHPKLQLFPMPENVAKHKAKKYGTAENVEIWGHSDSKVKYLFVVDSESQRRVLVTVFERFNEFAV